MNKSQLMYYSKEMPAETILSLIYIFLSCFIESFYFVWCKVKRSCQECLGEGAAIAVSARWTVSVAKVCVGITVGWGLVGYVDVMSCSECGSIRWGPVYGIRPVRTILPCLWQFDRCPSRFVHQREQKRFCIVLIPTTRSCWENRRRKTWNCSDTQLQYQFSHHVNVPHVGCEVRYF